MLTFKSNKAGTLFAALSGRARVGYVGKGNLPGRWIWHLSLLRPDGDGYMGVEASPDEAKAAIQAGFTEWLGAAGLSVTQ